MIATIEPGLPGTGPLPVHLHTGHPTPWTEGFVVRFMAKSGKTWIGNLQTGYSSTIKIVEWSEAQAVIMIAEGAVYFVRPDQPEAWKFIDLRGIDCVLSPNRDLALIATHTAELVAISLDGTEVWRKRIGYSRFEITDIQQGLIYGKRLIDDGSGEIELPVAWEAFVLELATGNDADPSDAPNPSNSAF